MARHRPVANGVRSTINRRRFHGYDIDHIPIIQYGDRVLGETRYAEPSTNNFDYLCPNHNCPHPSSAHDDDGRCYGDDATFDGLTCECGWS